MSKNIETCKSEEVLSSVLDQQPQDYPSVQQAVHDLGVTALPAASSADPDIEELPSNVEVFVRRVLKAVVYDRVLPVVQQMWQAVLNRISSPNYTPYSLYPYASNPSLRTLGTLPTALSALSPRKISNGGATNDGIKDGVSLAHLLGGSQSSVTEIKDDNSDWTLNYNIFSLFPNATKFTLGCKETTVYPIGRSGIDLILPRLKKYITYTSNYFRADYIELPELEEVQLTDGSGTQKSLFEDIKQEELTLPKLWKANIVNGSDYSGAALICNDYVKRLYMPALTYFHHGRLRGTICDCANLEVLHMDSLTNLADNVYGGHPGFLANCPKLIDLMFGQGYNANLYLGDWNPTDKGTAFLENFLHHIAERLAVGPTTNRLTLTLSADVYSACGFGATIDDPTDIRYQIKKAIQDRNWKVTDGTNNFNQ